MNRLAFRPGVYSTDYESWPQVVELATDQPVLGLNENRGSVLIDPDRDALSARISSYLVPVCRLRNSPEALRRRSCIPGPATTSRDPSTDAGSGILAGQGAEVSQSPARPPVGICRRNAHAVEPPKTGTAGCCGQAEQLPDCAPEGTSGRRWRGHAGRNLSRGPARSAQGRLLHPVPVGVLLRWPQAICRDPVRSEPLPTGCRLSGLTGARAR